MPKQVLNAPTYDRYKGDYARVVIDRRSIHLGKYGSEKSREKYRRVISEWSESQNRLAEESEATDAGDELLVVEVLEAFRRWAEKRYGKQSKRYGHFLSVIRAVRETYADWPARQFTPKRLKAVRNVFINRGNCRRQVNDSTRDVVAIFRWAAEEELVPGTLVESLKQVKSIELGQPGVRESDPVEHVPHRVIEETLRYLVPVVGDMVRLQLASGARPGEICSLTPGQVDRSGDVWIYRPTQHKTKWRGKERFVCFGPKSQEILTPYLLRDKNSPCFSPREAMLQHLQIREEQRTTPASCGNTASETKREKLLASLSDHYTNSTFRKAIHRACDRAFPAPDGVDGSELKKWQSENRWSPNQLRHTKATDIRNQFGLDAVQSVLGHSHARVSEIYATLKKEKAIEIARSVG